MRIANRPKRYVGRDSMAEEKVTYESLRAFYSDKEWMQERIGQLEQDMEAIRGKTPYAAVWYIRKSVGYEGFLKEYAAYRGLEEEGLFSVLEELQERLKEFRTLEEWLSHVEECKEALKRREPEKEEKEGVELLTIHRAKGLEYEVVFIIQANEGGIPYKKAATEEEIEEERRLFYVAMTRAKHLVLVVIVDIVKSRLSVCLFVAIEVYVSRVILSVLIKREEGDIFTVVHFIYSEDGALYNFVIIEGQCDGDNFIVCVLIR